MIDQTAFHETEMMRHFEAGRMASARWHCRVWTRLVAASRQDFIASGKDATEHQQTGTQQEKFDG